MPIRDIVEVNNPTKTKFNPIKEVQDIYLDVKDKNISRRNGMIYVMAGSGGSGKTNLLLNMFKSKNHYRNVFHNIYYFCPAASMASLAKHPFENHDKVWHELDVPTLEQIYNELVSFRIDKKKDIEKKKKKNKKHYDSDEEYMTESDEEEKEVQYSCIIIDDFADTLRNKDIQRQLSKMLIKARHLCCSFIFTLQSYLYFPKILRKQITYISLWKTRNVEEFNSIARELLNLNKDDALTLYNYCFDVPYNHLDIDTSENKLYKNFNLLELKN